jgi:hypothetical protein
MKILIIVSILFFSLKGFAEEFQDNQQEMPTVQEEVQQPEPQEQIQPVEQPQEAQQENNY